MTGVIDKYAVIAEHLHYNPVGYTSPGDYVIPLIFSHAAVNAGSALQLLVGDFSLPLIFFCCSERKYFFGRLL